MQALTIILVIALGGGAALVVLAFILLLLSLGDGRSHRWVRRHPVSPCAALRSAARLPERFAVYGRTAPGPGGPVVAPLSGEPAVWFRTIVGGSETVGEDTFTRVLWEHAGGDPFGVADHSGIVAVSGRILLGSTFSGHLSAWAQTRSAISGPAVTRRVVDETCPRHGPPGPWLRQVLDRGLVREHQVKPLGSVFVIEEIVPAGVPLHVIGKPAAVADGVLGLALPRSGRYLALSRDPAETVKALAADRRYGMGCAVWAILVGGVLFGAAMAGAFALYD